MFSAAEDRAEAADFARRGHDDRHHFRFIVAPKDAAEMTDLKAFTRDLVAQMERDLGTRLDWVAVDHWNTDNPHVHLLVRGVAEDGSDLVISRDYISHSLRSRGEELVSIEISPKPEHEVRSAQARAVEAERWTLLDVAIGWQWTRPASPTSREPDSEPINSVLAVPRSAKSDKTPTRLASLSDHPLFEKPCARDSCRNGADRVGAGAIRDRWIALPSHCCARAAVVFAPKSGTAIK